MQSGNACNKTQDQVGASLLNTIPHTACYITKSLLESPKFQGNIKNKVYADTLQNCKPCGKQFWPLTQDKEAKSPASYDPQYMSLSEKKRVSTRIEYVTKLKQGRYSSSYETAEMKFLKNKLEEELLIKSRLQEEVSNLKLKVHKLHRQEKNEACLEVNNVKLKTDTSGNASNLTESVPQILISLNQLNDLPSLSSHQQKIVASPNHSSDPPVCTSAETFGPLHQPTISKVMDEELLSTQLTGKDTVAHQWQQDVSTLKKKVKQWDFQVLELCRESDQNSHEICNMRDELKNARKDLIHLQEKFSWVKAKKGTMHEVQVERNIIDTVKYMPKGKFLISENLPMSNFISKQNLDSDFPPLEKSVNMQCSTETRIPRISVLPLIMDAGISAAVHQIDGASAVSDREIVPAWAESAQFGSWRDDVSFLSSKQTSFCQKETQLDGISWNSPVNQSALSYSAQSVCVHNKRQSISCAHRVSPVLQQIPELEEISSGTDTESCQIFDTSHNESTDDSCDSSVSHHGKLDELLAEISRLEEERRTAVERADELDEVVTRLDAELKAVIIECEQARHENQPHQDVLSENVTLKQQLSQALKTCDELMRQVNASNAKKDELQSSLNACHKRLARLTTKLEVFEANVEERVLAGVEHRLIDADRSRQKALELAERGIVELRSLCEKISCLERELVFLRSCSNVYNISSAAEIHKSDRSLMWGNIDNEQSQSDDCSPSSISTTFIYHASPTLSEISVAEAPSEAVDCRTDGELASYKISNHLPVSFSPATSDSGVHSDTTVGTFSDACSSSPVMQVTEVPPADQTEIASQVLTIGAKQLVSLESSSQRIARYTEEEAFRLVEENEELRREVADLQQGLIVERGWVPEEELIRAHAKNIALEERVMKLEAGERVAMNMVEKQEREFQPRKQSNRRLGKHQGEKSAGLNTLLRDSIQTNSDVGPAVDTVITDCGHAPGDESADTAVGAF